MRSGDCPLGERARHAWYPPPVNLRRVAVLVVLMGCGARTALDENATLASTHDASLDTGREAAVTTDASEDDVSPSIDATQDAALGDLILWLDAKIGLTLDGSNGVSIWADQSGWHHDASQTSAAARPTAQSGTVHFDGAQDYLVVSGPFDDFSKGLSSFIVVYPQQTTYFHATRFFDFAPTLGSLDDAILFNRWDTGEQLLYQTYAGLTPGAYLLGNGVVNESWQLFDVVAKTDGTGSMWRNGTLMASGSVALPTVVVRSSNLIAKSNRTDGADSYLAGSIAELRIYDVALDDATRGAIEANLTSKWGL